MGEKKTQNNKAVNIVVAVLLVIMAAVIVSFFINAGNKGNQVEKKPLDLNVTRDVAGISVSNNEDGTLTDCRIAINSKYTVVVDEIGSQKLDIPYSQFTQGDGTRFDFASTQPNSVYVSDCKEDEERYGAYEW